MMFTDPVKDISIRAPARGATPTLRRYFIHFLISIRAPARGATYLSNGYSAALSNFNPRSREGSDFPWAKVVPILAFQSALPRGERHLHYHPLSKDYHISIRAPARGATATTYANGWTVIFQSALPRGERPQPDGSQMTVKISIRAPARGATKQTVDSNFFWAFQSALPRGERHQFSPKSSLLS